MTLKEATENMTAALRDEDLPALACALADRAAAIKAGSQPISEVVEAGNRAIYDLLIMKQRLAFENARLEQVRAGLAGAFSGRKYPLVNYRG